MQMLSRKWARYLNRGHTGHSVAFWAATEEQGRAQGIWLIIPIWGLWRAEGESDNPELIDVFLIGCNPTKSQGQLRGLDTGHPVLGGLLDQAGGHVADLALEEPPGLGLVVLMQLVNPPLELRPEVPSGDLSDTGDADLVPLSNLGCRKVPASKVLTELFVRVRLAFFAIA